MSATEQAVSSGFVALTLKNNNLKDGWYLQGEILNNVFTGQYSGQEIFAELTFHSITWLAGGNGSAAGLQIVQNGQMIIADPGFGIGRYEILFEVTYRAPAFPIADDYRGVTVFTLQ